MNTVQREPLGHLNAQGLGPMGWYLQGQDPSGRVGGAASGRRRCSFPEAAEEGRQGRGDAGEGNGNPLQYSCLETHGWSSLVGYSPWGHKEMDTNERLQ